MVVMFDMNTGGIMKYTAQIIGGKHSGLSFEIKELVGAIEIPGLLDDGSLNSFMYYRQPVIRPVSDGGIVFYAPERR